ncbi:MAG: hypothetical protein A2V65_00430 [Deltaproteobacteria bacterium RBG_13_49_15]|nr:MAG: hypothetical protein A2V65_00430 [Deltaproteobacteria bacterium RBG_13_49_15]
MAGIFIRDAPCRFKTIIPLISFLIELFLKIRNKADDQLSVIQLNDGGGNDEGQSKLYIRLFW